MQIALFPLNVVLFPGSKLPMHIFEERYKVMINECISENHVFGMNYMSEKNLHSTGCTAMVSKVVKRSPNGELDIEINGVSRYLLKKYELNDAGFFTGEIMLLEENNNFTNEDHFNTAVTEYNKLIDITSHGLLGKIIPSDTKWRDGKSSVSFFISQKCGLTIQERQLMLEINTEDERLKYLVNYFEKLMPKIKEADRIATIIKNDGYLQ